MSGTPVIEMRGITKSFPGVKALRGVSFACGRGEVHALCGENGAGKSTLIKILSGAEQQTRGRIFFNGKEARLTSPKVAMSLGIETIYQDSALVGSASIMRNFFAGRELTRGLGILNTARMNEIVMDQLMNVVRISGINSPDIPVEALSGGQRQAVAIARAVYFKTAMLLLDEPTSALSVRETDKLLAHLSELKEEGVSAVFITHNLYHAYESCDRFTILSRGRVIRNLAKAETSVSELNDIIVKY